MLQIMKYHFRILLRNREQMFWILLFPILLGIMFKVAFSNISSSEIQRPVSIAVVEENNSDALKNIKTFLEKNGIKRWSCPLCSNLLHRRKSRFPVKGSDSGWYFVYR